MEDTTMEGIKGLLGKLIDDHREQMEGVIKREKKVSVALQFKIVGNKTAGEYEIETKLRFVEHEISDKLSLTVREGQGDIFEKQAAPETPMPAEQRKGAQREKNKTRSRQLEAAAEVGPALTTEERPALTSGPAAVPVPDR